MSTCSGVDGATVRYDVLGTGEPLVALAGGAAAHPRYLGDLAGLAEYRRLVIPHRDLATA